MDIAMVNLLFGIGTVILSGVVAGTITYVTMRFGIKKNREDIDDILEKHIPKIEKRLDNVDELKTTVAVMNERLTHIAETLDKFCEKH